MTASIEFLGVAILIIFCVIPLIEFRHILSRLRRKPALGDPAAVAAVAAAAASADVNEPPRGAAAGEPPEGRGE